MINEILKAERKKRKLTCDDIAKQIGKSKSYYWQIENCKRNLYYSLAVKIAKVLKTKPDKIFYDYYSR